MRVRGLQLTDDSWDRIVDGCEYATFFHTRCWVEIVTRSFPFLSNAAIALEFEGGRRGLLPLVKIRGRGGVFCRYASMWPGVYGGIVSDSIITARESEEFFCSSRDPRLAGGYWFGSPLCGQTMPSTYNTEKITTRMVDLTGGMDAVWWGMESTFRRRVKRARELGVTVQPAASLEDYEEYYEVYMDSLQRWGDRATSNYPYALFRNIQEAEAKYPGAIKLWLARIKGRVAAGALVFYHGRHAVSWHAATRGADYEKSPANALQMDILEDAFSRGFSFYDLGSSSGHKGVERFKIGMGAAEWSLAKVNYEPGLLWKACTALRAVKTRVTGAAS